MMDKVTNILMVGVGGQGTILASRIIGSTALRAGMDVKVSEIHGMAQRGGSVVTHVRFGGKVYAPTIEPGTADVVLAFEKLEALRWLHYLRQGGTVIVNTQEIYPLPVLTGASDYPRDIMERVRARVRDTIEVDALEAAVKCGSSKAVNVVLLGVLASRLGIDLDLWRRIIEETVPGRTVALNLAAFEAGLKLARNS